MNRTPYVRFMEKVAPEPNCGCWLWTGAYHRQGYGQFCLSGKTIVLAHRASWLLHNGWMPPPEVKVCHACDVPECVNPDHLWLGSTLDNARDASAKGRLNGRPGPKGSLNARARLNEDQVRSIKGDTRSMRAIAADYQVSPATIYAIRRGDNWGWL